ncbi:hypothetical protein AYI70_g12111 [Smittium culicis]|uniref:Mediator of RNA polymerase II transcription subunit 22 n=1 Tax=Smittium culicis TaxID=133412 RepID=A0A1R1WYT3_9FUNG|nr:hypothetical protein AYI70_g12111 [Smittium culicis]
MFQKAKSSNEAATEKKTYPFNAKAAQEQNSEYSRKVTLDVENLVYALSSIVSHSKIQDKDAYWVAQESFLIQSKAVLLVKSAENLLKLVFDLKRAYLVNDTFHLLEITKQRNARIDKLISKNKASLLDLQTTLDSAILDLKAALLNK